MSNPKIRAAFDGTHIILGIFSENGEDILLSTPADSNGIPYPLTDGQQVFEEAANPEVEAKILRTLLWEEMQQD